MVHLEEAAKPKFWRLRGIAAQTDSSTRLDENQQVGGEQDGQVSDDADTNQQIRADMSKTQRIKRGLIMNKFHRQGLLSLLVAAGTLLILFLVVSSVTAGEEASDSPKAHVGFGVPAFSRVTSFTAIDLTCEVIDEGTTSVDDDQGVSYSEGEIYKGIIISDNELINGTRYIMIDHEIDQETGDDKVWVTGFFYPDAVDGTWIVPGEGEITAQGPDVHHRGHGTRELDGLRIRFKVRGAAELETPPCEPLFPPVEFEGIIIELP